MSQVNPGPFYDMILNDVRTFHPMAMIGQTRLAMSNRDSLEIGGHSMNKYLLGGPLVTSQKQPHLGSDKEWQIWQAVTIVLPIQKFMLDPESSEGRGYRLDQMVCGPVQEPDSYGYKEVPVNQIDPEGNQFEQ